MELESTLYIITFKLEKTCRRGGFKGEDGTIVTPQLVF